MFPVNLEESELSTLTRFLETGDGPFDVVIHSAWFVWGYSVMRIYPDQKLTPAVPDTNQLTGCLKQLADGDDTVAPLVLFGVMQLIERLLQKKGHCHSMEAPT